MVQARLEFSEVFLAFIDRDACLNPVAPKLLPRKVSYPYESLKDELKSPEEFGNGFKVSGSVCYQIYVIGAEDDAIREKSPWKTPRIVL